MASLGESGGKSQHEKIGAGEGGGGKQQSGKISSEERKVISFGAILIGTLSGVAQFLTDDLWSNVRLFAVSSAVVLVGLVLMLAAMRIWRAQHRSVTLRLGIVVVAVCLSATMGAIFGLVGHILGTRNPSPPGTSPSSMTSSGSSLLSTSPTGSVTLTASPSAHPTPSASQPGFSEPSVDRPLPPTNQVAECASELDFDRYKNSIDPFPVGIHVNATGIDHWSQDDHLWVMVYQTGVGFFPTPDPPQRAGGGWRSERLQFGADGSGPDRARRDIILIVVNDQAEQEIRAHLSRAPGQPMPALPAGARDNGSVSTTRTC